MPYASLAYDNLLAPSTIAFNNADYMEQSGDWDFADREDTSWDSDTIYWREEFRESDNDNFDDTKVEIQIEVDETYVSPTLYFSVERQPINPSSATRHNAFYCRRDQRLPNNSKDYTLRTHRLGR